MPDRHLTEAEAQQVLSSLASDFYLFGALPGETVEEYAAIRHADQLPEIAERIVERTGLVLDLVIEAARLSRETKQGRKPVDLHWQKRGAEGLPGAKPGWRVKEWVEFAWYASERSGTEQEKVAKREAIVEVLCDRFPDLKSMEYFDRDTLAVCVFTWEILKSQRSCSQANDHNQGHPR